MAEQFRRLVPATGLFAGAWALLPPYSGPALDTAMRVEIADHVVPGIAVLVVSVVSLLVARNGAGGAGFMLVAGLAVLLAGLWMTATHVPLVIDATRDRAPAGATLYHAAPGVAVLALGFLWAAFYWSEAPS